MVNTTQIVTSLIGLVVGILILTSLGGTVISQTATNSFNATGLNEPASALENASATGKTMYSLIELLYPIIGVIIVITAGFVLGNKYL